MSKTQLAMIYHCFLYEFSYALLNIRTGSTTCIIVPLILPTIVITCNIEEKRVAPTRINATRQILAIYIFPFSLANLKLFRYQCYDSIRV